MSKAILELIPDGPWSRSAVLRYAAGNGPITLTAARDYLRTIRAPLRHAEELRVTLARVRRAIRIAHGKRIDDRRDLAWLVADRQRRDYAGLVAPLQRNRRQNVGRFDRSTIQQRLASWRGLCVSNAAWACLWYGRRHKTLVEYGSPDPGVTLSRSADRTVYRGRRRDYEAARYTYTIRVPGDWLTTVHARGFSRLGGMLTLSLREVRPGVYAARWAQSAGPGRPPRIVDGWISGEYHSTVSADDAERRGRYRPAGPAALDLDSLVARAGSVRLTRRHAMAAGLCDTGIESWLATVGLADRRSATVADIVAAYRARPRPEVLRVLARVR